MNKLLVTIPLALTMFAAACNGPQDNDNRCRGNTLQFYSCTHDNIINSCDWSDIKDCDVTCITLSGHDATCALSTTPDPRCANVVDTQPFCDADGKTLLYCDSGYLASTFECGDACVVAMDHVPYSACSDDL